MNPFIVVDACQNHNGDQQILKEMIQAAKEGGADCIKIQSIRSDELTHRKRFEKGVFEGEICKTIERPYEAEYNRLKSLDLGRDLHAWFVEECHRVGIQPMTTVFTFSELEFLATLDWDTIKIASYDCASLPLLKSLKKRFKKLIVSTGATYDNEIEQTAALLKGHAYAFLHCVTIYPTPLDEINLRRIDWLRQFTPEVGYSDHSLVERDGLKAAYAALFFGAAIIERHFTILDRTKTKDGPVSINPDELSRLVAFSQLTKEEQAAYIQSEIPEYDEMLGEPTRALSDVELLNRDYYRGRFAAKAKDGVRYNWEE